MVDTENGIQQLYALLDRHPDVWQVTIGVVMSHLLARVLRVLKEDRPYEIRDLEGKPIDKNEARKLILSKYHVSEEVRREMRRRNAKANVRRKTATASIREAAKAPQTVQVKFVSRKKV